MSQNWDYQIRVNLSDEKAAIARKNPADEALSPLGEILARHHAQLKNQFDAFAEYVSEAEHHGVEHFPLYKWTKATIEDAEKKAKHLKSFSVHVKGEEVYPKAVADALEADLQPLVERGLIARLSKHDTNPANNPQAPAHLR
ncbi:MAG TPA: hypothetical protein VED87_08920 [Methylocystis sp.]|nr:hypothetical protein [Methylocystis sp.]